MATSSHIDPSPSPSGADGDDALYDEWIRIDSGGAHHALRIMTSWFWRIVYRCRAVGAEHIPAEGAFLMVPNHSSYADPFVQAWGQRRIVRFMTKSTLLEKPVIGRIVRTGGGFPVRRGQGDQFALELARRLLRDGQPVVIYPEGTRFRDAAELGPAKRGAARLALEAGVPVVPVATWGIKRRSVYGRPWWRRPRATIVYGAPLRFDGIEPTPDNVARVRDEIWAAVGDAYEQARAIDSGR